MLYNIFQECIRNAAEHHKIKAFPTRNTLTDGNVYKWFSRFLPVWPLIEYMGAPAGKWPNDPKNCATDPKIH